MIQKKLFKYSFSVDKETFRNDKTVANAAGFFVSSDSSRIEIAI